MEVKNKKMEDTVKEIKKHISFSEYTLYKNCPYKWFLVYVNELKEPTNEFLVFGSALHKSIEELVTNNTNQFLFNKLFLQKVKEESTTNFSNSYFGKTLVSDGVQLLRKLDFKSRFRNWEVKKLEEEIYEPLVTAEDGTQLFFKGFIDFVGYSNPLTMILDWKTAIKPWDIEKKQGDIKFSKIYPKLKNNEELSMQEIESLNAKFYFAQPILYKHFYSLKHNISEENIIMRYCCLSRNPIEVQQYEVINNPDLKDFILEDIKKVALEIYQFKKTLNVDLKRAKNNINTKSFCKYCKLSSEC